MKKKSVILGILLTNISIFAISSCNLDNKKAILNSPINNKNTFNILSGKVDFPDSALKFNITAVVKNIAPRSVITLNYPSDYSDETLRNSVIATGLSDSKGNFSLSSNIEFIPKIGDVFILEATKRLKGIGFDNISLRTNVKWNGKSWDSINKKGMFIDSKTTALSIIQSLNPNILTTSDTIGRIDLENNILVPESINKNLKSYQIDNVANLVERALKENKDPVSSIGFANGEYFVSSVKAETTLLTGCLGEPSNCNYGAAIPVPTPTPNIFPTPNPTATPPVAGVTVDVYEASIFAGSFGEAGVDDVNGVDAKFDRPYDIKFDNLGNLIVADSMNGLIRKIDTNGNVTTIPTFYGSAFSLAIDSSNNIYVGSIGLIKKIDAITGLEKTIYQSNNSYNEFFRISDPRSIILDNFSLDSSSTNIFIADTFDSVIRKIPIDNNSSTFDNSTTVFSNKANVPNSIITDYQGNFYISYNFGSKIGKMDSVGSLTNFSGSQKIDYPSFPQPIAPRMDFYLDGQASTSQYHSINSMSFDGNKNIILTDGSKLRKVDKDGNVSTITINSNSNLLNFTSDSLQGLAIDRFGNIFVSDYQNNVIIKLTPSNSNIMPPSDNINYIVQTVVGNGTRGNNTFDSPLDASLNFPLGIRDISGILHIADTFNSQIRRYDGRSLYSLTGYNFTNVDSLVRNPYQIISNSEDADKIIVSDKFGSRNVNLTSGSIENSAQDGDKVYSGFVKDYEGYIYSSSATEHVIRKAPNNNFLFDGNLVTLNPYRIFSGSLNNAGFQDGDLLNARFNTPRGMAKDRYDNIYIADSKNHAIRKIDRNGNVTTFAGNGLIGFKDGNGRNARFNEPTDVAVDSIGNVYVVDKGNNRIRKINPQGDVWTIAGNGSFQFFNGTGANAMFNNPTGISLDSSGGVYISDTINNRIRKLLPQ